MTDAVIIEPSKEHRSSVIWLHGLGADGHDFEPIVPELGLSEELGIRFIFPNAPVRPVTINGGMEMRAWYDIKNPDLSVERDRQDFDNSALILNGYIEAEINKGIAADKIVVAGFSQGGAIALHAGLVYPKTLAGLLILSSYLPFADILDTGDTRHNHETPVLMMHGEYDPVIPLGFAEQSYRLMQEKAYPIKWHSFPMQHGVCAEEIVEISRFFQEVLTT